MPVNSWLEFFKIAPSHPLRTEFPPPFLMRLLQLAALALPAFLLSAPIVSAQDTFYTISSVSTSTTGDYYPVSNLILGPGSGFNATTYIASGPSWVTGSYGSSYFAGKPAVDLTFDLGSDVLLYEISTWYYANSNSAKDFSVKFATSADGTSGFGTSISYNPSFTAMAPSGGSIPREIHAFSQNVTARYVRVHITTNYYTPGSGGDRVGLSQVAFSIKPPDLRLQEGFNYTAGASIAGQNGGTGFTSGSSWSTTGSDTVGTGLSYPGLTTSGAGDLHTGNYGGSLRGVAALGGTYYMSMLVNMHGTETVRCGPELRVAGSDGCLFGRVTGGWGMFSGGNGTFGITNSTGVYKTWTGVTATSDSNTHLLVYKFDSTAKVISLWVDPTLSSGETTPSATLSTGGNWTVNLGTTISEIRVFHEQAGCDLDELRFGVTWAAVLPADTFANWISTNYPSLTGSNALPGAVNTNGLTNVQQYAFGTDPTNSSATSIAYTGSSLTTTGPPVATNLSGGAHGVNYKAVFCRRTYYSAAGLTYTPQFSADLSYWVNSTDTPSVVATNGTIDAVSVPYPLFIRLANNTAVKPTYFRVAVSAP